MCCNKKKFKKSFEEKFGTLGENDVIEKMRMSSAPPPPPPGNEEPPKGPILIGLITLRTSTNI